MTDELYMRRCIQLARNGEPHVSPNPMVGAVIVCDGKIIGEGYHTHCGSAHAEVNAIRSVKDQHLLKRSTIYVSLEPCSHYGKTPPCCNLIIEKQIPRVVVGCQDPFPEVSGRGIQNLRNAGKEVTVGVLEKECKQLIRKFLTHTVKKRPYITLKWAQSADGYLDICREGGSPVILSTPETSLLVHKRRSESDAIMVGTNTARLDNPSLTIRNWYGQNPVRMVIDRNLILDRKLHLFDGRTPTLVFTEKHNTSSHNLEYINIDFSKKILPQIMKETYNRKIQSILVEGGSELLQSFLNEGLWDECYMEMSHKKIGYGVKAPEISDKNSYTENIHFGVNFRYYRNSDA